MLSGCTRTYNITKYNSQADYYRDFNSSVTARKVTVELKDSSVISPVSAVLMSNDTLFTLIEKSEETESAVPLSIIKSILNSGNEAERVELLLDNKEKIPAVIVGSKNDSLFFYRINKSYIETAIAPADKVLKVQYKNRWAGAAYGMTAGFFAGGVVGLGYIYIESTHNERGENTEPPFKSFITGAAAGLVIGGVIGWLTGYGFIYSF